MYPRTVGFELEVNTHAEAVANALHEYNITPDNRVHSYHCRCATCGNSVTSGRFKAQYDSSLSSGVEIISPPMSIPALLEDTRVDTIEAILCTTGAGINENCGLHVHVGVQDLTERGLSQLHDSFVTFEMAMYHMAIGGQKTHRGGSYASPISKFNGTYENLPHADKVARLRRSGGHSVGLNFRSSYGTVEYRLWNATRAAWRVRLYASTSMLFTQLAAEGKSPSMDKYKLRKLPLEAQSTELHLFLQQLDSGEARDFVNGVYQDWFESQMFNKPRSNDGNNVIQLGAVRVQRPDLEYGVVRTLDGEVARALTLTAPDASRPVTYTRHEECMCYMCGSVVRQDRAAYITSRSALGGTTGAGWVGRFCASCATRYTAGAYPDYARLHNDVQALPFERLHNALTLGQVNFTGTGELTGTLAAVVEDERFSIPLGDELFAHPVGHGVDPEVASERCDNTGDPLDDCGCEDCCPDDYCSDCHEYNSDCTCCGECGMSADECTCCPDCGRVGRYCTCEVDEEEEEGCGNSECAVCHPERIS